MNPAVSFGGRVAADRFTQASFRPVGGQGASMGRHAAAAVLPHAFAYPAGRGCGFAGTGARPAGRNVSMIAAAQSPVTSEPA
jgi:hypothetical protein